jgi:CRP-like cAMP-binding protein
MWFAHSHHWPVDIVAAPLFRGCNKKQLDTISTLATRIDAPAGSVLCEEGEIGLEFFVIVEGSVDVERAGRRVTHLNAGDTFGEVALLARGVGSRRTATVVATEPLGLLVFSRCEFNSLVRDVDLVSRRLLTRVGEVAASLAVEHAA